MTTRSDSTQSRLRAAAFEVVRDQGIGAASARSIAACANVNQALVFYHFGSVSELIEAASNEAVDARVADYRQAFSSVGTLAGLLTVARSLRETERAQGTVTVMSQLMAAGRSDPILARATQYAIAAWTGQVRSVLDRVLATSPIADLVDSGELAQLISTTFVGVELTHGAAPEAADAAFAALERINGIVAALEQLGPVSQKAIRIGLTRTTRRA